jgi:hypothetical protein
MGLIPSGLGREIRDKFGIIKKEVYKSVIIHLETSSVDCPNCLRDASGASLNKFDVTFITPITIYDIIRIPTFFTRGRCPICSGKGVLEKENLRTLFSIIKWNPTNDGAMEKTPAGIEGFNVVSVKTDKCNLTVLKNAKKAIIDGVECVLLLPPVIRSVGQVDIMAVAYFVISEVGINTRVP